ncbi:MAG: class I tRNA ligase family protein [Petrimonas sp.]|nr:class I tRNA ligase family protein [Petrimonas sp.]
MDYNFGEIEKRWQQFWIDHQTYKVTEDTTKPKFYVLDMFPYPSGAGLHVGHPLGYIASDIFSRFKRLQGFNVLHPMGYDAYGLPAEQYAIQTGQHPAITTKNNIARYREQLDKIGFSYDWSREVQTCDPDYYKWTQWAFIKMFHSYYCNQAQQARPIEELIEVFSAQGTKGMDLACTEPMNFTAEEWNAKTEKEKQEILMNYRIAYLGDTMVNWCPALGTVLANDEVSEGVSIRGGYPVEQKKMRQWCLRVSAYAPRLLEGLDSVDWTESLKETQRNWIGRSEGAVMHFDLVSPETSPFPPPAEGGEETSPPTPLHKRGESQPENNKGFFKPTTNKEQWKLLINIAKEYRSNQTESEDILWQALRAGKIGYKIRRQHIVDGYIADFINLEKSVIIEVDGGIHLTKEQKEKDDFRTSVLEQCGFSVLRFTNQEVLTDVQLVANKIKNFLDLLSSAREKTSQSAPLSRGEGQGERSGFDIFTTRADTIFGVTFMVLAPESELVEQLTTDEQREAVQVYLDKTKKKTERERIADKSVTGIFSGSYATHPFTGEPLPIWISDYVLAGYGTGAIMGVPAHDSRDYAFAKHFNLPIVPLIEGCDVSEESFDAKEGIMINSGFLNGMTVKEAIPAAIDEVEKRGLGFRKVNYRLRDAIFSRQRYWGEPFPIYYKDGMPYTISENDLPLELPEVDKFLPTETGEPPLGRAKNWSYLPSAPSTRGRESSDETLGNNLREVKDFGDDSSQSSPSLVGRVGEGYPLELSTMPGFAGSSAYYLRYMDPHNDEALVSRQADEYWRNVDLYIGGTEHATGHLIYSRFWNKFLFDLGVSCEEEPFKKLVNQGMIQGRSNFVYRIKDTNTFVSLNLKDQYDVTPIHVDVNIVHNDVLDIEAFRNWNPEYKNAEFILEYPTPALPVREGGNPNSTSSKMSSPLVEGIEGRYICGWAVEKMSKSMYNVVNPDDIVENYGADTLRLYEMFLGPLEQSKPWDTNGIDGVHRFLKKLWNLFYAGDELTVSDEKPSKEELRSLHKLIKKVTWDIENFSFNTSVSAFMICVNELTSLKSNKKAVLSDLLVLLAPFAPHIAEELWHVIGNQTTVCDAKWPEHNEEYLKEDSFAYAISFNGKARFVMEFPADATTQEIEKAALEHPTSQKWMEGKTPKKIIIVPKKIVNVVI